MSPTTSTRAFLVDQFRFDAGINSHNGPILPRQDIIKTQKRHSSQRLLCTQAKVGPRSSNHPNRAGKWGLSELDTVPLTENVA